MTTWRSGLAQMEAERSAKCELLIGRCCPAGYEVRFLRTAVLLRACGLHGTGSSSSKLFGVATAGGRTGGYDRRHVSCCERSGHSRSLPSGIRAKPQLPGDGRRGVPDRSGRAEDWPSASLLPLM